MELKTDLSAAVAELESAKWAIEDAILAARDIEKAAEEGEVDDGASDDLESLIGVVRDEHMRGHDEASMRFCGPVCKAAWTLGEGR